MAGTGASEGESASGLLDQTRFLGWTLVNEPEEITHCDVCDQFPPPELRQLVLSFSSRYADPNDASRSVVLCRGYAEHHRIHECYGCRKLVLENPEWVIDITNPGGRILTEFVCPACQEARPWEKRWADYAARVALSKKAGDARNH